MDVEDCHLVLDSHCSTGLKIDYYRHQRHQQHEHQGSISMSANYENGDEYLADELRYHTFFWMTMSKKHLLAQCGHLLAQCGTDWNLEWEELTLVPVSYTA